MMIVIGVWTCSSLVAFGIKGLLIPVSNRLAFSGDIGNLEMWLWLRLPEILVAALAAIAVLRVMDRNRPLI